MPMTNNQVRDALRSPQGTTEPVEVKIGTNPESTDLTDIESVELRDGAFVITPAA